MPVSFFFDDMPEEIYKPKGRRKKASKPIADASVIRPETLEFARTYYRIPDADVRKCVRELAKSLAKMT